MLKDSNKLIPISIIIAGALIAGSVLYINKSKFPQESALTAQQAAEKAINYINQNMLPEGQTASLISTIEESGIYKIRIKIGEDEYDSYVTKDGKFLFPTSGIDLTTTSTTSEEPTTQEGPKRDKPDVKLFVMSYCPFGLQAQKMFLPVYNLLKDKADMGVYFVNYIMHEKQEIDENLRQYCIQKEEKEKFYDYLSCFVQAGDFNNCLNQANIDKTKLDACLSTTDKEYGIYSSYNDRSTWLNGQFPRFDVHLDLNERYGVRGSPTIVINDTEIAISNRSPEKFKEVICQAFNSPPSECNQTLSNETPSSGFGSGTSGSGGGQCE